MTMTRKTTGDVAWALCLGLAGLGACTDAQSAAPELAADAAAASPPPMGAALDAGRDARTSAPTSMDAAETQDGDAPAFALDPLPKTCGSNTRCGLYGTIGLFEPCCVGAEADGGCGISTYGGPCSTRVYGRLDPSCPNVPTALGTLPGCCRPDGLCGFIHDLGCSPVYPTDGAAPMSCSFPVDEGAQDGDAGIEGP